jgi:hypothetical protein|tara:strand:- start:3130 stop:3333 length:204 start_codon:yes stop_codon:yes gene_type:complete
MIKAFKDTWVLILLLMFIIYFCVKSQTKLEDKLDVLIENTNDERVALLQDEVMDLGSKLDSMHLKYD